MVIIFLASIERCEDSLLEIVYITRNIYKCSGNGTCLLWEGASSCI